LYLEISVSKCEELSPKFATMKTPQARQTPQGKSEPKRLEYRSPSVAKLGKLANLTLAVDAAGTADGGMGTMTKT
jgi:hypothetical protein